ncbi:MAG: LPS-assembly protein LptD, partial [Pseudomonadota bacterium]
MALALAVPDAARAQQASPATGGAVDYLWGLCEPFAIEQPPTALTKVPDDERVHIEADAADMHLELTSIYRGNAHAQFGTTHLEADLLRYDPKHETLDAEGNVRLTHDGDLFLRGSAAQLRIGTEQGTFEDASFRMYSTHSLGTASSIEAPDPDTLLLRKASYTTCNQPKPAWSLTSSKIKLDKIEKQGSATNVLLRAKGVPIFYWPYIRFPLTEERLTGFLFPSIGVSNKTGTDLRVPFYWNIAPSMDMTITPRYMSKRGLMLENEYRYLTRINGGELDFGYIPDDEQFGDDRGYFSWKHSGSPLRGWSTNINYNFVSDETYLEDLGGDLSSASLTSLDRIGEVRYDAASWSTSLRVQDFQTLSGTSPYARLPQYLFDLRLPTRYGKVNYHFNTELVNFDHSDRVPTGGRYDFQGGISLPWRHPAAYVTPKLIVRHTQYDLNDTTAVQEEKPDRTLPVASIDSGVFFERNTSAGNTPLLHTLEPRLKYLYIPERNQDDLPFFDTVLTTPSFARLFEDYVFTGPDRVADANRISAALT